MRKHDFVIAYDIADTKRLPKVAKCLEKYAFRLQKSVFFYPKASRNDIKVLAKLLKEIIDETEDDIRIYTVDVGKSITLNKGIELHKINLAL